MQADAGEPESEEHVRRERLLREAIDLRSRITLAQDRYGVLKSLLPEPTFAPTAARISAADKVLLFFQTKVTSLPILAVCEPSCTRLKVGCG